ncbi:hypothetical protein LCGC14_3000580 [marine sediment metagenome]|uniref:Uncharacterized protein n=1 Tax=marine sediment metagenome TaxID=412755 RepID=A0A0F8Z8R8_9ZZZZ
MKRHRLVVKGIGTMKRHFIRKGDSIKVLISMMHNDPPLQVPSNCGKGDLVWMRQDWDEFAYSQLITAAFPDLTSPEVEKALDRAWNVQCEYWDRHDDAIRPSESWAREADVFYLSGTSDEFLAFARRWADSIKWEFDNLGGDDSTYDYFPDYVDGFRQLCQALDATGLYKDTVANITRYYRDDVGEELISESL